MEAHKINKNESISLIKKMKNPRQLIQRDPYLFYGRYSIEVHSKMDLKHFLLLINHKLFKKH